ncbi:MAG: response regulator [Gammaproteobacteria bacterium]
MERPAISTEQDLDLLRGFFDETSDMLAVIDVSTDTITTCNRTLCHVLGRERKSLVGEDIRTLYHPGCFEEVDRVLNYFRETQSAHSVALELQNAQGERIPVALTLSPNHDSTGKPSGCRAIWRDMSLQRKVERLQLELRLQETQKTQSLGLLAGGIAHDFNNLLVAIIGNAGLGLLEASSESSVGKKLVDIETAAQRAADLTKQLMAYSGAGGNSKASFDLSKVVTEMGHLLDIAISRKAVLQYDLAGEPVNAMGDITQIRQVIMNLLTNSSDAIGSRSGLITIRTGVQDVSTRMLRNMLLNEDMKPGQFAFLEVSDTGKGIATHLQDKIFDPFFTTKTKGHGLGLAAVLGIVRNHHGTLDIQSEPGNGTTIRVMLPVAESTQTPPPAPAPARAARDEHVLVVDDEEHVLDVAKQMLEHHGFRVSVATNGREALEAVTASANGFDLILMDVTMPEMDGMAAYKAINKIHGDSRIVLMSGYSQQHTANALAGLGHVGFLQKPFRVQSLIHAVVDGLDSELA